MPLSCPSCVPLVSPPQPPESKGSLPTGDQSLESEAGNKEEVEVVGGQIRCRSVQQQSRAEAVPHLENVSSWADGLGTAKVRMGSEANTLSTVRALPRLSLQGTGSRTLGHLNTKASVRVGDRYCRWQTQADVKDMGSCALPAMG